MTSVSPLNGLSLRVTTQAVTPARANRTLHRSETAAWAPSPRTPDEPGPEAIRVGRRDRAT
eukprot:1451929-Rhodomonas_salina.3